MEQPKNTGSFTTRNRRLKQSSSRSLYRPHQGFETSNPVFIASGSERTSIFPCSMLLFVYHIAIATIWEPRAYSSIQTSSVTSGEFFPVSFFKEYIDRMVHIVI